MAGGATAVIVLAGVIAFTQSAAMRPSTGAVAEATLRANAVKAIDGAAADVLAIHRTSSISDGEALNEDVWSAPSAPRPAQQVHRRSVILDASGSPVQDVEVTYTMPADPAVLINQSVGIDATGTAAAAFRTTGSTIDVDYPSRSWTEQDEGSMLVAVPDDLAAIRAEIASGDWTAGTASTVGGLPAVELTWHGTAGGVTHDLWLNAETYLPIRELYTISRRIAGKRSHRHH